MILCVIYTWIRTEIITSTATGPGSIIQSNFGKPGNFEVVVLEGQNLVHYYRDKSSEPYKWYGPTATISTEAVDSASLIQSTFGTPPGNFELATLEFVSDGVDNLVHYYRDNSSQPYKWYKTAVISTQAARAATIIQSNYNSEDGPGTLEAVVVIDNEGDPRLNSLLHYYRGGMNQPWVKAAGNL